MTDIDTSTYSFQWIVFGVFKVMWIVYNEVGNYVINWRNVEI